MPNPLVGTLKVFNVVYVPERFNKNSLLNEVMDRRSDLVQNSYIMYTVGSEGEEGDEFYEWLDNLLKTKYNAIDGESVILLVWW